MTAYQLILIFLAFGLVGSLFFSMQIKLEMRRSELNWKKEVEQVRFQLNEHRSRWIQVAQKLEEPTLVSDTPTPAPLAMPRPARARQESLWAGSTKSKAVEMLRRGESSAKISAALSLPKPQVEFLMKLEGAAKA